MGGLLDKLHVIAVISNPVDYQSRYSNFQVFKEDFLKQGVKLWTLEMATGGRLHKITTKCEQDIQVWSSALPGELWHKENMINIAIQHIARTDPDFRYIAWIDADLKFEPDAMEKTVQALQVWDVVQMWSHSIDFDPAGGVANNHVALSYMYAYWKGIHLPSKSGYAEGGHPGYAWAIRREALNRLGGLIDWGVLGSADRHMACALTGDVQGSVHQKVHPSYIKWLKLWQHRADVHVRKNVGYVANTIRHLWHGRKADRGYASRWSILVKYQFNPETDLKRDVYGLWQLVSETPRQIAMRDEIRKYFRARKEDATTI